MKLKVCRIRDIGTATTLVEHRVDFLGFHVLNELDTNEAARSAEINRQLRQSDFDGGTLITRSIDLDWLANTVEQGSYRYVQIHRDVDLDVVAEMKEILARRGAAMIQVIDPAIRSPQEARQILEIADYVLYDNYEGGTGRRIPEERLALMPMERAFVAGGIDAERARLIRDRLHPYAIDVQSWLERPDKSKDFSRVDELVSATASGPPDVWLSVAQMLRSTDAGPLLPGQLLARVAGVHVDVTDATHGGAMAKLLSVLYESWPNLLYDLHFVSPTSPSVEIIEKARAANQHLNRVFTPSASSTPHSLLAASASDISRGEFDDALGGASTVLITAPSPSLPAEDRASMIDKAVKRVESVSHGRCRIILDRDLDAHLGTLVRSGNVSEIVVGKALLDALDQTEALARIEQAWAGTR